jgi:hypothetical protein
MDRLHHADARHHCRTTVLGHQHQGFDGGPPFRCVVLALRQLGDVGGGVAQGAQLAAVGQRDQKGPVGDELSVWSGVYADIRPLPS